jgi:hypothetical protein
MRTLRRNTIGLAVDRLMPAKTGNRRPGKGTVAANGGNELVTQSVTSRKLSPDWKAINRTIRMITNAL